MADYADTVIGEFRGALIEHVTDRTRAASLVPDGMAGGEHFVDGTTVNSNAPGGKERSQEGYVGQPFA